MTEEIRDIIETEKIGGWTTWVILATLISASWLLIQDLWPGHLQWLEVEIAFVVVTLGLSIARSASRVLAWNPSHQGRSGPFFFLHHKVSPLGLLSVALWMAATSFVSFRLAPTLGWLTFGSVGVVYSLSAFFSLLVMGAVIARVPLPMSGASSMGRPVLTSLMLLLLTLVEVVGVIVAVRSPTLHSATLVEIRTGAMLALGAFGIRVLSRRIGGDSDSRRRTLSEIRCKVALHTISLDEGLHHARLALYGMGLSDVVLAEMQELLGSISSVRNEYDMALQKATSLRANISVQEPASAQVTELDRLALGTLLEVFEGHEQRVLQVAERYHTKLAAVRGRLEIISGVYKAARIECDVLLREIRIAEEPVNQLQVRFVDEYTALQELWNTWCPTTRRNHRPFASDDSATV